MDNQQAYTNRLIHEESNYLLQHSGNPVEWFPWGNEAFEKARNENKLVLISIGYSSCHWCHVMEDESFKDPEVADLMNTHYVSIKVDREERPDIDHIYMDAVQILTGSGGWPLNVFALPDGRPVFGGTYFPKQQWMEVLQNLSNTYQSQPERVRAQADQIARGMSDMQLNILSRKNISEFKNTELQRFLQRIKTAIDSEYGGTKGAPKFPMPGLHSMVMKYYFYDRDKEVLDYLHTTLTNLAKGGIYDQLEGGFARYSTDKAWKVPHFEKMLYDNAQLASLFSQAFMLTHEDLYKQIAEETLQFLQSEMLSEQGIFYSSYDADSEGQEGKY